MAKRYYVVRKQENITTSDKYIELVLSGEIIFTPPPMYKVVEVNEIAKPIHGHDGWFIVAGPVVYRGNAEEIRDILALDEELDDL
jgi:hypothetical protein